MISEGIRLVVDFRREGFAISEVLGGWLGANWVSESSNEVGLDLGDAGEDEDWR